MNLASPYIVAQNKVYILEFQCSEQASPEVSKWMDEWKEHKQTSQGYMSKFWHRICNFLCQVYLVKWILCLKFDKLAQLDHLWPCQRITKVA